MENLEQSRFGDRFLCDGKKCYDKKGAQTVKNLRYAEDRVKLRIYCCSVCGMWHLTKTPKLWWLKDENEDE